MFGIVGYGGNLEPWEIRELCDEMQADKEPTENEMEALRRRLTEKGITWQSMDEFGKKRTLYPGKKGTVAVICGDGTYGGRAGLLEAWNPGERHTGWHTANGVLASFPPMKLHGQEGL